jgi:hypothetical protein
VTEVEGQDVEYVVYSDTRRAYRSTGRRAGQMAERAPQIAPDRWSHAVAPGSDVTACGTSTNGLYDFSGMAFRHINPYLRCRACNEATGRPQSRS